MLDEKNWKKYVEEADHHVAIGNTRIFLFGDDQEDKPWSMVQTVNDGCTHRLDIATSVDFRALHPCGLTFKWSWDIELRGANGTNTYQIGTVGVQRILSKLPPATLPSFTDYLRKVIEAVQKRGGEYQQYADIQFSQAATIRGLLRNYEVK